MTKNRAFITLTRFAVSMTLAVFVLFAIGFVLFSASVPRAYNKTSELTKLNLPRADGIVVFTGSANERLYWGARLLQAGFGERLLISGLYAAQNFNTLRALVTPETYAKIECCVDLDYRAANTKENAIETARWARVHGFTSLIVVTSAQHVPRASLEMRRQEPHLRITSFAIAPANVKFDEWWRYPGTFKLLLGEYMRLLWALTGLPQRG